MCAENSENRAKAAPGGFWATWARPGNGAMRGAGRRAALGAALSLVWPAGRAAAHALVLESEPATGAELAHSPARIRVRFNSRIEHARSRLQLFGPDGARPIALLPGPPDDPASLAAPCPPLPAGSWRLRWQVLALDGHITRGDIPFRIR